MSSSEQRLDISTKISEIVSKYEETTKDMNFTVLLMGLFGSGKTRFICTGRRPILIDSFDPRGTLVIQKAFPQEINKSIFVRTYWNERSSQPTEYMKWETQWEKDINSGFLNNFGTYAIDSVTTMIDALSWRVSKKEGGPKRDGARLLIQDYVPIYNTVKDIVKVTASQSCDFILTAHLVDYENELTNEITAELDTYKRLKSQIPILFTEKYVINAKPTAAGTQYRILTRPLGKYRASTQIGSGTFDLQEEPDLKGLLRKAGFPHSDKESVL